MVPAEPFAALLRQREERDGCHAVANELRRSTKWVYRYKNLLDSCGRPAVGFDQLTVEDALVMLGLGMVDVYPELVEAPSDTPPPEGYCSKCDEKVLVGEGLRCLWCDTPTGLPETAEQRASRLGTECPDCGGEKAVYAKWCFDCGHARDAAALESGRTDAPRLANGQYAPGPLPAKRTCPTCGSEKSSRSQVCYSCYRGMGLDRGRRRNLGAPPCIDQDQLELARDLYYDYALTFVEIADHVSHRYCSVRAACRSLGCAFKARGWEIREGGQTRMLSNERKRWTRDQDG